MWSSSEFLFWSGLLLPAVCVLAWPRANWTLIFPATASILVGWYLHVQSSQVIFLDTLAEQAKQNEGEIDAEESTKAYLRLFVSLLVGWVYPSLVGLVAVFARMIWDTYKNPKPKSPRQIRRQVRREYRRRQARRGLPH